VLILCTIVALGIANSRFDAAYDALFHTPLGLVYGDFSFTMSLRHWINEGLMGLFFFLIGLEIKREILVGELQDAQRSIPVFTAALGGMLVPALIYYSINGGTEFSTGWGIPMATDTAFAVGILALLGRRIPATAMTYLTALAIIDDLGAIVIIAVFYSGSISLHYLTFAAIVLIALVFLNILGIRQPLVYLLGGALVWSGMLGSGIHATVAGVLVAAVVPARPKRASNWFVGQTRRLMREFEAIEQVREADQPILAKEEQHAVVESVRDAAEKSTTPLRRWERALEHPVALVVIPVFALANAGIPVGADTLQVLWSDTLAAGIFLGLTVGKVLGIVLFAWLAIRLKLGRLPTGLGMTHIAGIGLLGGMGFTMSIFIAHLGFGDTPETLVVAKSGIIAASLVAGIAGYLWLRIRG
jgi:NhaA family Na+:H+ antiporter